MIHHNSLHLQDSVSTQCCSNLPLFPSVPSCEQRVLHVGQSQAPLGRQRRVNTASQGFVFKQDHYFYYCNQRLFNEVFLYFDNSVYIEKVQQMFYLCI